MTLSTYGSNNSTQSHGSLIEELKCVCFKQKCKGTELFTILLFTHKISYSSSHFPPRTFEPIKLSHFKICRAPQKRSRCLQKAKGWGIMCLWASFLGLFASKQFLLVKSKFFLLVKPTRVSSYFSKFYKPRMLFLKQQEFIFIKFNGWFSLHCWVPSPHHALCWVLAIFSWTRPTLSLTHKIMYFSF